MKTTFIVKDFHDELLDKALANPVWDAFKVIEKWAYGDLRQSVKVKYGTDNSFRSRCAWNDLFRKKRPITAKVEPRKGYQLITFEEE